ncbi:hypothetical protein ES703_88522 [subsurface metagenome]
MYILKWSKHEEAGSYFHHLSIPGSSPVFTGSHQGDIGQG